MIGCYSPFVDRSIRRINLPPSELRADTFVRSSGRQLAPMKVRYQPLQGDSYRTRLRADLADAAIETGETPSFRRLHSHTAPLYRESLRRKSDDAAAPLPGRFPPTALLVFIFVAGAAAGLAGAYLVSASGGVSRLLIDHPPFAPVAAVSGRDHAYDMHNIGVSAHPQVDRNFLSATAGESSTSSVDSFAAVTGPGGVSNTTAPQSFRPTAPGESESNAAGQPATDADVAALIARGERQIAEHRLEEPAGNNALETYRRIAAMHADGQEGRQFGEHLSAAFYLSAATAMREKHWNEALHDFDVLKALPPVPISGLADLGEANAPDRPPAAPTKDTGSKAPSKVETAGALPRPEISVPEEVTADTGNPASSTPAGSSSAPEPARSLSRPPSTSNAPLPPPRMQDDSRLKQDFELFLTQQARSPKSQPPMSPQDKNDLFADFLRWRASRSAAATSSDRWRHTPAAGDRWQALQGTNLRKEPSAQSAVIGEIGKGTEFRVIGTSADMKWLEVERDDGTTGYYWSARAKKIP